MILVATTLVQHRISKMKSLCAVTADGQTVFKDCTPRLIAKYNCSIHVNMLHVCAEAPHWSCRFFALPPTSVPKADKAPEDQARILQKGIPHKSRARSNQPHFRHFAIAIAWSPVPTNFRSSCLDCVAGCSPSLPLGDPKHSEAAWVWEAHGGFPKGLQGLQSFQGLLIRLMLLGLTCPQAIAEGATEQQS